MRSRSPEAFGMPGFTTILVRVLIWFVVGCGPRYDTSVRVILQETGEGDASTVVVELVQSEPLSQCLDKDGDTGRALARYQLKKGERDPPWPEDAYGEAKVKFHEDGCELVGFSLRDPQELLPE